MTVNRRGTETRQRTAVLTARVLPDERAAVDVEAARRGITVPELVRRATFAVLKVGPVDRRSTSERIADDDAALERTQDAADRGGET